MITSSDIARLAGVSQTTVSRVLNNRGKVAPEKAELVRQIIRETGYEPNALARSFVKRRTDALGIFMFTYSTGDQINDNWTGNIVGACHRVLRERGSMMMFDLIQNRVQFDRVASALRQRRIDGALLLGGRHDINVRPLLAEGFPIALVNRQWIDKRQPNVIQVTADNTGGTRAAVEHILSLGHKRIGYFAGHVPAPTPQTRLYSLRATLEPLGLYDESLIIREPKPGSNNVCEIALDLFRGRWRNNGPTAILSYNDEIARSVMDAASMLGMRVPQDLSIVGYDNRFPVQYPFTTVNLPTETMCRVGLDGLMRLVDGQPVPEWNVVLPCNLIVRDTTAPPRQV